MKEEIDFIELEKKRDLPKEWKEHAVPEDGSITPNWSMLDMRINKIHVDEVGMANIVLVFKLDYCVSDGSRVITKYATLDIELIDSERVLATNPTSGLAIAYIAKHYKETGERLYELLNEWRTQYQDFPLEGIFQILDKKAQERVKVILENYFGKK